MDREELKRRLYKRYIEPTKVDKEKAIGVEIEMPIVNLKQGPTDQKLAQSVFNRFVDYFNFEPDGFDDNGICYSATLKENGDNISFDCSYNNLELSLGKENNIHHIYERFKDYVTYLNQEFKKEDHLVTGLGINPYYKVNDQSYIPSERYRMLERYLSKAKEWDYPMYFHPYHGYGTFSSASQTQLDFKPDELADTIEAFQLLEPIKSVLFSNSILEDEPEFSCVRDLLWENSTHGINPHNIGMFKSRINNEEDLIEYLTTTSLFNVERDGRYIHFEPRVLTDYFNEDKIEGEYYKNGEYKKITFEPDLDDLRFLRTYKFEDPTFRGTIEFRSSCNQPFSEAMTVPAFHVGLKRKASELLELLENDTILYNHGFNPDELRKLLNRFEWPEYINKEDLKKLIIEVLDLAKKGLEERGLNEEIFLEPLYKRARTLTSPAQYVKNKEDIIEVVKRFSDFNEKDPLELN